MGAMRALILLLMNSRLWSRYVDTPQTGL